MPRRTVLEPPDWVSAYIVSTSSSIGGTTNRDLPLPTLPTSVSEAISLNTNDQAIVARSAPIVSYINTNARTLSFTIGLSDEYMPNRTDGSQYTLHEYVNALKSLEYPNYKDAEVVVPQVIVKVANISLAGICTGVNITWNGPVSNAIYKGANKGTFTRADVSLQFKEVMNSVKGSISIKNGDGDL